ncbi:MAG: hypothetical protein ACM3MJ_05950 [Deltaproteobacteria bacterium]
MRIRLPRLQRDKRFRLFIADAADAPPDRWFGSLKAALRAFDQSDARWKHLAWIIEYQEEPRFGGIPVARDVVHMRYGELAGDAGPDRPGG